MNIPDVIDAGGRKLIADALRIELAWLEAASLKAASPKSLSKR